MHWHPVHKHHKQVWILPWLPQTTLGTSLTSWECGNSCCFRVHKNWVSFKSNPVAKYSYNTPTKHPKGHFYEPFSDAQKDCELDNHPMTMIYFSLSSSWNYNFTIIQSFLSNKTVLLISQPLTHAFYLEGLYWTFLHQCDVSSGV